MARLEDLPGDNLAEVLIPLASPPHHLTAQVVPIVGR